MAITELSICNSALIKIGGNRISSLTTDTSKEAQLCNEQYDKIRDEVLSSAHWKFARKRAVLAQVDGPTFGFAYAYQLPTDFLKVIEPEYMEVPYQIEDQTVVTDESPFRLTYLAKVANTSKFTPKFAEVVAARLAAELAYALTGSATVQANMWQLYKQQLSEARSMDSQQGSAQEVSASEWLNSRW